MLLHACLGVIAATIVAIQGTECSPHQGLTCQAASGDNEEARATSIAGSTLNSPMDVDANLGEDSVEELGLLQHRGASSMVHNRSRVAQHMQASRTKKAVFDFEVAVPEGIGYVTAGSRQVERGCGSDNQKCRCKTSADVFRMTGRGNSDSATGLDFTCKNVVINFNNAKDKRYSKLTCSFRILIPYKGNNAMYIDCGDLSRVRIVSGFDWIKSLGGEDLVEGDEWKNYYALKWGVLLGRTTISLKTQYIKRELGPLPNYTKAEGRWWQAGSGGSMTLSESVTSDRTLGKEDSHEVSHGVEVGATFGTDWLSASITSVNNWADTITNTFEQTDGTDHTVGCSSLACSGAYYQWQITSTSPDPINGPSITTKTCDFVCQPQVSPDYAPMCPLGFCNHMYWPDTKESNKFQCPCCLESITKVNSPALNKFICKYDAAGKPFESCNPPSRCQVGPHS
jgi:hypothetical protein